MKKENKREFLGMSLVTAMALQNYHSYSIGNEFYYRYKQKILDINNILKTYLKENNGSYCFKS